MTIREAFANFHAELSVKYPSPEAKELVYRLFDFYLNMSKVDIALDGNGEFIKSDTIEDAVSRLLNDEPLQYILGEADFMELTFKVDENVLIPRPETEELVSLVVEKNTIQSPSVLEIGTGSGCIPISVKHAIPTADVSACDISEGALEIARYNADKNKLDVNFFYCDILNVDTIPVDKYDIIISNPPYICDAERTLMRANVLDFEPDLALFVPDDNALLFYKAITEYATLGLKAGGFLYFEINEAYGNAMKNMVKANGFVEVKVHNDIYGKERMLSATKA